MEGSSKQELNRIRRRFHPLTADLELVRHLAARLAAADLQIDPRHNVVGMDRANVSDVVRRLLERGFVAVRVNPAHARRRLIKLTAPLSIRAENDGINPQTWPVGETVSYIFPGTEYTANKTMP